jgi:hypothetical protein
LTRFTWGLNNANNKLLDVAFADESTKQTRSFCLFHMRPKNVHVSAAISWFGETQPVVKIYLFLF